MTPGRAGDSFDSPDGRTYSGPVTAATPEPEREPDPWRDDLRAEQLDELAKLRDVCQLLAKITSAQVRVMYAAWIEIGQHRNIHAAVQLLAEQLDGFDGPEWNGTETGMGWLERTQGADL